MHEKRLAPFPLSLLALLFPQMAAVLRQELSLLAQ
jgi:hypothetical protein